MTTTTERPPATASARPPWYVPFVGWRVITLLLTLVGIAAVLMRRGIVVSGPLRWTAALAFVGATALAAAALGYTLRPRHVGRVGGFSLDFLIAVVAAFVAFNRMDMFTGLDAVGEAFNDSAGWLLVIVLGWLVSGFRSGQNAAVRTAARWTMLLGVVILALSMGLVPGVVEFISRLIQPEVFPIAVLAVLAGTSARLLWSDAATRFYGSDQRQLEALDGMLFVAPNALGFLAFFAGPLIVSLFISFTEWDGLTDATFVGLRNYADLLSDDLFLRSLRNIVVFGVIAIPLAVAPAVLLASVLNSKLPGMKFFRAVYFLPSIAGVVGVTLIWKQLFDSTVGYVNFAILKVTEWLNALLGSGLDAPQPQWISDTNIALFSVIILFVWQQIGFNTVLFLAGMQGIDGTLYEAAELDGAGPWKKFVNITIPMLRPTTVFVVATTTILALQLFNEPFILQSPSPPSGPGNATLTPVIYLYQNAFQEFEIGYASAVAWALFLLIFGVTLLYFRRSREDGVLTT